MIWVDYCILTVIVVSILIGILRGFAREALGLATWLLAGLLAWLLAQPFDRYLEAHIGVAAVRHATAYGLLFLAGLLIGGVLTSLIVSMIKQSRFSPADRTLGGGFGLIRGVLLVSLFVLLAGMTPISQDAWWRQSMLLPRFEPLAQGLGSLMPRSWLAALQPAANAAAPSS